jgi:hypothetical protein
MAILDRDAALAIGQQIGDGVHTHYQPLTEHTGILWLLAPGSRSWASVTTSMQPPYPVEQAGPRRLFDEVAQAYRWWLDADKPTAQDWLVTVGPQGQRIELAPAP